MNKNLIKVGAKCRWIDPFIIGSPKEERNAALERVFTIVDINNDIISIDDGATFAEVYANELLIIK